MTDLFEHQSYDDIIGRKVIGLEDYGKIIKVNINNTGHGKIAVPFEVTFEGKPDFWCDTYCFKDADDVISRLVPTKEKR